MTFEEELRHLAYGASDKDTPEGVGLLVIEAACPAGADQVLGRCRAALSATLRGMHQGVSDPSAWRRLLPRWFVDACVEQSTEQVEQWLAWWSTLPDDAKASAAEDRAWSLDGWLHWLTPQERQWWWWDAECVLPTQLQVRVQIDGWPAPTGALRWLLRTAGASVVTVHED